MDLSSVAVHTITASGSARFSATNSTALSLKEPERPRTITQNKQTSIILRIEEDLAVGKPANVELSLQFENLKDAGAILIAFNEMRVPAESLEEGWLKMSVNRKSLRKGANRIDVSTSAQTECTLKDLVLWVRPNKGQ